MKSSIETQVEALIHRWNRSIVEKDFHEADKLRHDDYRSKVPFGGTFDKHEELAILVNPGNVFTSITADDIHVELRDQKAVAMFKNRMVGELDGDSFDTTYQYTITFEDAGDGWKARQSTLEEVASDAAAIALPERLNAASGTLKRLFARALRLWSGQAPATKIPPRFPDLAYIPFKTGEDFFLPRARAPSGPDDELPIPPRELWLGYHYTIQSAAQVATMLEIASKSGYKPAPGHRILDLGCGAGRMIRYLRPYADFCEIWGADISAAHIIWCKQNLSPPFNFVNTTKTPHLPFEDKSFDFIYCGSLFTHIDDLADAWLLELKRILAPDGRIYLTIHDEHSLELIERSPLSGGSVVRGIAASETLQAAKGGFSMLTIGRDHESQVFYSLDYFLRSLTPSFDVLSVTEEAYFYQTAILLARKGRKKGGCTV